MEKQTSELVSNEINNEGKDSTINQEQKDILNIEIINKNKKIPVITYDSFQIKTTFLECTIFLPSLDSLKSLKFFDINDKSLKEVVDQISKFAELQETLESALMIIGLINKKNEDLINSVKKERNLDININYLEDYATFEDYLKDNIHFIFSRYTYSKFKSVVNLLENSGLNLKNDENKNFYLLAQKTVYEMDPILIIICGNNFSWFKTSNKNINSISYDLELNKHNYIFWNKSFLTEVMHKFNIHPRIKFGFISSVNESNLERIINAIKLSFSSSYGDSFNYKKEILMFSQNDHKSKKDENGKEKFFRNMDKIKKKCSTKEFTFNDSNIVILEADNDKTDESSNTEHNTIKLPYFMDEKYFYKSPEEIEMYNKMNESIVRQIIEMIIDSSESDSEHDVRVNITAINEKIKNCEFN